MLIQIASLYDESNLIEVCSRLELSEPLKVMLKVHYANKSVKGTRRPLTVLEFCFLSGSAASLKLSELCVGWVSDSVTQHSTLR